MATVNIKLKGTRSLWKTPRLSDTAQGKYLVGAEHLNFTEIFYYSKVDDWRIIRFQEEGYIYLETNDGGFHALFDLKHRIFRLFRYSHYDEIRASQNKMTCLSNLKYFASGIFEHFKVHSATKMIITDFNI